MTFPRPWGARRRGIYHFIRTFPSSVFEIDALPDDEAFNTGKKIRWVSGGSDGVSLHQGDIGSVSIAAAILAAVRSVVDNLTDQASSEELYRLLIGNATIGFIDPFIALLDEEEVGAAPELAEYARWLATEAPDREPVKFAVALLGKCGNSRDEEIFAVLGRHEEFTLYAAVALTATSPEPDQALWKLATQVHGWGRIQIVDRLGTTSDAEIKRWMLRHGYKNSVMDEYLAYRCATTGNLLFELKAMNPDDELLAGAGGILRALLRGGPAPDMRSYADGAEAVTLYLHHLATRPPRRLDEFLISHEIKAYVERLVADTDDAPTHPWTAAERQEIGNLAIAILGREEWPKLAKAGLCSDDHFDFRQAAAVLEALGIDAWNARLERQRTPDSDEWYWLMKTDVPARIQKVIDLVEQQIDLDKIASGPADELARISHSRFRLVYGRLVGSEAAIELCSIGFCRRFRAQVFVAALVRSCSR